jgi:PleD family two-component response regulator
VTPENAQLACRKLLKAVEEQPFDHEGKTFSVGICLGTSTASPTQNKRVHPEDLLAAATTALEKAYAQGPHQLVYEELGEA